jgi:hypothetical protein
MMRVVIRASLSRTDPPRDTLEKANAFVLSVFFVISDTPATLVWPFPSFCAGEIELC